MRAHLLVDAVEIGPRLLERPHRLGPERPDLAGHGVADELAELPIQPSIVRRISASVGSVSRGRAARATGSRPAIFFRSADGASRARAAPDSVVDEDMDGFFPSLPGGKSPPVVGESPPISVISGGVSPPVAAIGGDLPPIGRSIGGVSPPMIGGVSPPFCDASRRPSMGSMR